MRLESASRIASLAQSSHQIENKRALHLELAVGRDKVVLRDQKPLHAGNMRLPSKWKFGDFIDYLNRRVFFWAGTSCGPCSHGVRHLNRYQSEGPVMLRIPFDHLVASNGHTDPQFCKYNSGSPRCSYGTPSPRGPDTFVTAIDAPFGAANVVEVTYEDLANLPRGTEVCLDTKSFRFQPI